MSRVRSTWLLCAFLLVFLRGATVAWSQCESWQRGFDNPYPGVIGPVRGLAVFDDGTGPALYAGGRFTEVGDIPAMNIARWDGVHWTALGPGLTTPVPPGGPFYYDVWSMTGFDDGTGPALYAGGAFTRSGATVVNHVAKWNGTSWQAVGSGLGPADTDDVRDFCVFDDGTGPKLYACGEFVLVPGDRGLAAWNGSTWSSVGGGTNGICNALAVFDDGGGPALFIGGSFTSAGGVSTGSIAKWDGTSFSALGAGVGGTFPTVYDLAVHTDGTGSGLFATGEFFTAGGMPADHVAKWDGANWSALGAGLSPSWAYGLADFDDGSGPSLYATGIFAQAGGMSANSVAKWDGATWSPLGTGLGPVGSVEGAAAVSFDDGTGSALYVAGRFSTAGGVRAGSIARWDGTNWSPLGEPGGQGANGSTYSIAIYDDGSGPAPFVGGLLYFADPPTSGIAKWNGSGWTSLGGIGYFGQIHAQLVADPGGGPVLYAAGIFDDIGGVSANKIARWNGSSWSPLANGIGSPAEALYALATHDEGSGPRLFAGGQFSQVNGQPAGSIARWDGSSWTTVGIGVSGLVRAMVSWDDGSGPALFVGGNYTTAGGIPASRVARWNGSTWSALGAGMNDAVRALEVFDDGTGEALYAGGNFTTAGGLPATGVARWNGASWSPVGSGLNGLVDALAVHDDGGGPALYASGNFQYSGTTSTSHVARWNGSSWAPLASGTDGRVLAMASLAGGPSAGSDLWIGGEFTRAADLPSAHVGVWRGCAEPVDRFCFGDGSVAPCPCANVGVQSRGCNNSQNTGGARLYTSGATIPDTLVLHAVAELPTALTIFLQGDALIPGSVAFGDGIRCVGGHLRRLYSKSASGGAVVAPGAGDPSITARSAALGDSIPSGGIRYYMAYYRDPNPAFCPIPTGNTFNAGNGVRVVW